MIHSNPTGQYEKDTKRIQDSGSQEIEAIHTSSERRIISFIEVGERLRCAVSSSRGKNDLVTQKARWLVDMISRVLVLAETRFGFALYGFGI
ncbi:unnamed protein product [Thlaspi arvense]|uniref:Uncharacterized protein n=1 Tax=Thlaspi arvense TaxID=13288 RepID=A0AAU9SA45_THLAR|nr:unnamed protein product [Thlaspi arvense]